MNFFLGVQTGDTEQAPRSDLRCANSGCDLYRLRLEADEVTPTPGSQPDRCASCGQQLQPFTPPGE